MNDKAMTCGLIFQYLNPVLSGGYFADFTTPPCNRPFVVFFTAAGVARGTDAFNDPDLAGGQQRAVNPDRPAPVLSSKLATTGATGDRRDSAAAGLSGVCVQYPAASALALRSVACAASWICAVFACCYSRRPSIRRSLQFS